MENNEKYGYRKTTYWCVLRVGLLDGLGMGLLG